MDKNSFIFICIIHDYIVPNFSTGICPYLIMVYILSGNFIKSLHYWPTRNYHNICFLQMAFYVGDEYHCLLSFSNWEIYIYYFVLLWTRVSHCGLVTSYGGTDLGQHWLMRCLDAWRHQSITWINVYLSSVGSSDIHPGEIQQEVTQPWFNKFSLKITGVKFNSNLRLSIQFSYADNLPNIDCSEQVRSTIN